MSGLDVLFAGFGVVTAGSALLAVTSRQVVHAALWLVVALAGLAGCYLLLGAEVLALVQLLIYVGAVVVLVLFALMLTRAPVGAADPSDPGADVLDQPWPQRVAAALTGGAVTLLLGGTLLTALGGRSMHTGAERGRARDLGEVLFGSWVLPFELLSVLLLASLVAALALSDPHSPQADSPERGIPQPHTPQPDTPRSDPGAQR